MQVGCCRVCNEDHKRKKLFYRSVFKSAPSPNVVINMNEKSQFLSILHYCYSQNSPALLQMTEAHSIPVLAKRLQVKTQWRTQGGRGVQPTPETEKKLL